jgi:dTDP-4-dehydrorhamnose reductase
MRILLLGATGQIGFELAPRLRSMGELIAPGRDAFDLDQPDRVRGTLDAIRPELIVNAAAFTDVDAAESDSAAALRVNAESPAEIARWAARHGAALVHYSSDYVYSGDGDRPWRENDPCEPVNAYGRSKLAGDRAIAASGAAHVILRTGWVYAARGRNFVRTILNLARERQELSVVNDERGTPTWARCVAEATERIVAVCGTTHLAVATGFARKGGVFHVTCAGETTWYDLARSVIDQVPDGDRILRRLLPVASEDYGAQAQRPRYSVLDNAKIREAWGIELPQWHLALQACLQDVSSESYFD